MKIGIYIYDNAEVLDFAGPFEVFSTACRVCADSEDPFSVILLGETGETVSARGGFHVIPDYGIHNHPPIDVLIIAGGVHTEEMQKTPVMAWISRQAGKVMATASVCTGVFLLAQARIEGIHTVTTHWEDIPDLRSAFPSLDVVEGVRWVDEGRIVTSGGISAGIDMCLHLVQKFHSRRLAETTAKQMEFCWVPEP